MAMDPVYSESKKSFSLKKYSQLGTTIINVYSEFGAGKTRIVFECTRNNYPKS